MSSTRRLAESPRAYFILAVMVALTLLVGAFALRAHPSAFSMGETTSWQGVALNLKRGFGYSLCNQYYFPFCDESHSTTAMREPAPVLLFAGVAYLFNESLLAASATELALLVGVMVALFFLTREWADAQTGLLAAFAWALYPRALSLVPQVSGDLLAGLGVTVGVFFVLRARRTERIRDWLLAGVGLSVALMSRSAMLMVALTVIAGLIIERWSLRHNLWNWIRPALLIGIFVASFLTLWLARTTLTFGRPLIGSSLVGYNIYRHNYILETNDYLHYVGNDEGYRAVQALIARRADLRGNENEAEMDAVYRQEGIKIIAAHPIRYVLLSGYRFFPLWFDWRVSEGFGYPMGFTEYGMVVVQAILLILAFIGLQKNARRLWVLWASLTMVSLAYMAVDSRMLYTSPIMPLVISLSAAGALRIQNKRRVL